MKADLLVRDAEIEKMGARVVELEAELARLDAEAKKRK